MERPDKFQKKQPNAHEKTSDETSALLDEVSKRLEPLSKNELRAVPGGRPWRMSQNDEPGTPYGVMPAPPEEKEKESKSTSKTVGQLFAKVKARLSFRRQSGEEVRLELSPPQSGQRSGSVTPYGEILAVKPQSSPAKESVGEVEEKRKGSPSVTPQKNGAIELPSGTREADEPDGLAQPPVGQSRVRDVQKQLESAAKKPAPKNELPDLPVSDGSVKNLVKHFQPTPSKPANSKGASDVAIASGSARVKADQFETIIAQHNAAAEKDAKKVGQPGKTLDGPTKNK